MNEQILVPRIPESTFFYSGGTTDNPNQPVFFVVNFPGSFTFPENEIIINVVDLFDEHVIDEIQADKKAIDLMSKAERENYERSPDVFDALAKDLSNEFLGEAFNRADQGFKEKTFEWFKLLVVRIDEEIEVKGP